MRLIQAIATLTQVYMKMENWEPQDQSGIEKVLEKLERDAEYRQGLEEDLENLKYNLTESVELERISNEAQMLYMSVNCKQKS